MEHARHAERFLVDLLPDFDKFNKKFILGNNDLRTVIYSVRSYARLSDDGIYALVNAMSPFVVKGNEQEFDTSMRELDGVIGKCAAKHAVHARVTHAPVKDKNDMKRTIPAIEIAFDSSKVLVTIGSNYVQVYFPENPGLPTKSLEQWSRYGGLLGATDAHGHCLKFSPQYGVGAFELDSQHLFEFDVIRDGKEYFFSGLPRFQREHLTPVEIRQDLRERHHVSDPIPQYHLASFIGMLRK